MFSFKKLIQLLAVATLINACQKGKVQEPTTQPKVQPTQPAQPLTGNAQATENQVQVDLFCTFRRHCVDSGIEVRCFVCCCLSMQKAAAPGFPGAAAFFDMMIYYNDCLFTFAGGVMLHFPVMLPCAVCAVRHGSGTCKTQCSAQRPLW